MPSPDANLVKEMDREDEKKNSSNTKKLTQSKSGFWLRHEDPIIRLTGWIACFTFALLLVTAFQAYTFTVSERAIISIDGLAVNEGKFVANKPMKFTIGFHNFGRSVAFPLKVTMSTVGVNLPDVPTYAQGNTFQALAPIAPGSKTTTVVWPSYGIKRLVLTEELAQKIESGEIPYFIYGTIEYVDPYTFWSRYKTGFCFQYFPTEPDATKFLSCVDPDYIYAN